MSIVEKAVGHAGAGRKNQQGKSVQPNEVMSAGKPADSSAPIVCIQHAADAGMVSLQENEALSKEFRFLKRPILAKIFVQDSNSGPENVIMITSDLPGAGKTFIAFNLAVSIAMEQLTQVVLIDSDPLRRNLTHMLRQESRPGFMETLADRRITPEMVTLDTDLPNLRFMPCGQFTVSATELLASRRVNEALDVFDATDTVIILDSAPLLLTSEAHALAERVDHTVVVIEAGRTSGNQIDTLLKRLSDSSSSIGFILNKTPASADVQNQGYYNYY